MNKKNQTIPLPGQPVRGSKSGEPIMALFDLLGRRWAMGVLWQLCDKGPATFRDLQSRCEGISPAVLNARIKELRQAQLLDNGEDGYCATQSGQNLFKHLSTIRPMVRKLGKRIEKIKGTESSQCLLFGLTLN